MNTVEDIIKIAKISQYLSQNDIVDKGLYGGGTDLLLPRKLYNIRKSVEWANNNKIQEVQAIGSVTINSNTNGWTSIEIFVNDPYLGSISFGKSYVNGIGQSPSDIAANIATNCLAAAQSYGYNLVNNISTPTVVYVYPPIGYGSIINGNNRLSVKIL